MNDFVNCADSIGFIITLSPTDKMGSSIPRLVNFYKRFGFIKNKDKSISKRLLVRYPAKQNIEEEYPSSWNLEEFKN